MRLRSAILCSGTICAALLPLGSAAVQAQPLLEKLEQSVQTQTAPAATAAPAAEPGYLGIVADDVTNPTRGVQLIDVLPGGPAQTAGLQPGDYITSIDGRNTTTLDEMSAVLSARPAGDRLAFVIRRGQQVQRIDVTLGKRPPPGERKFNNFGRVNDPQAANVAAAPNSALVAPAVESTEPPPSPPETLPTPGPRSIPHPGESPAAVPAEPPPLLGVRAVPITPELQLSLNLPEPRGAMVVEIRANSPAQRVGIPLEAVIVAVDGKRIDSPQQLAEALQARGLGATVRLSYFRYGQLHERAVKLGEGGPPPVAAAPETAPAASPATATPATAPPLVSAGETETEALRRRVKELEAKLAEMEALLKSQPK